MKLFDYNQLMCCPYNDFQYKHNTEMRITRYKDYKYVGSSIN